MLLRCVDFVLMVSIASRCLCRWHDESKGRTQSESDWLAAQRLSLRTPLPVGTQSPRRCPFSEGGGGEARRENQMRERPPLLCEREATASVHEERHVSSRGNGIHFFRIQRTVQAGLRIRRRVRGAT